MAERSTYSRTYGTGKPPVKSRSRRTVNDEEAREKQSRATELRASGASYDEIAKILGYHDASGARKAVEAQIRRFEFESTREALRLDLARLDEYQKICTHRLRVNGDVSQIDRLMRIMEKRHWMLGVTPATLAETQPDGTQKTAGGMNVVVASSERVFVRSMMMAVGQDPDSPEGRAYLAARGLSDEKELPAGKSTPEKTRAKHVSSERPDMPPAPKRRLKKKRSNRTAKDVSTYSDETSSDVIDAEIVSITNEDAVRDTARAISIRARDEEQVGDGVRRLDERKI